VIRCFGYISQDLSVLPRLVGRGIVLNIFIGLVGRGIVLNIFIGLVGRAIMFNIFIGLAGRAIARTFVALTYEACVELHCLSSDVKHA
jgi:hypothetical protein